jgi:competence protein ComEC
MAVMKNVCALAAALLLCSSLSAGPAPKPAAKPATESKDLHIYWIDMEGGASTLIVAPSGESLLVDTGIPVQEEVQRIYDMATKVAHLKKLDYVLITHYHGDHVGGLPALSKMIQIDHFLDHGDLTFETEKPNMMKGWNAYKAAADDHRTTMHPGDNLPLKGVNITVVSAAGETITKPINGGGPNEAICKDAPLKPADRDPENSASVGILLKYGKFRFVDLGDLPWYQEQLLACPTNMLGHIDVYQTTHHGTDRSGSPQLVYALHPTVAVMNNGPTRGDQSTFEIVKKSPGLEDLWQGHLALKVDKSYQADEKFIASLDDTEHCKGNWIQLTVKPDGHYTVTNTRNNFSKTYMSK